MKNYIDGIGLHYGSYCGIMMISIIVSVNTFDRNDHGLFRLRSYITLPDSMDAADFDAGVIRQTFCYLWLAGRRQRRRVIFAIGGADAGFCSAIILVSSWESFPFNLPFYGPFSRLWSREIGTKT